MPLEPIALPDAELFYAPDFLARADADCLLKRLTTEIAWEQHHVKIFGRKMPAPRLSAWYGDPDATYAYSGSSYAPLVWTALLQGLKTRVESAAATTFNSVLLNQYRDGRDSMGWHSDDEPELGPAPAIASVSLGGERRFILRHKKRRDIDSVAIPLAHGSLLIMRGPTQSFWKHQVPKTKKIVPSRLNLTFRRIGAP